MVLSENQLHGKIGKIFQMKKCPEKRRLFARFTSFSPGCRTGGLDSESFRDNSRMLCPFKKKKALMASRAFKCSAN